MLVPKKLEKVFFMNFSHPQDAQGAASAEEQAVYVEELAGSDDYWLSITDASRVCRVQDVSIRRAIQRKVLPVRRQRAGQNKRTRFVRASDLAQAGFPIIDESAAISTEIGKVDILNIPRQQQLIMQEHQALMLQLGTMQEALASSQQQMSADLLQQQERWQASLQTTREEQSRQLVEAQTRISQEQQKFQHVLTEASQRLANEQQTLRQDLTQEQARTLSRDERIQASIDTTRQDLAQQQADALTRDEQVQTALVTLQTALPHHLKEVQRQLGLLADTQQTTFHNHQETVKMALQHIEQETQARLLDIEQRVTNSLQQFTQTVNERVSNDLQQLAKTFGAQLADLGQTLARVQQSAEDLRQNIMARDQDFVRTLQQMQTQIDQYEQLLPLLPYVRQQLATEQALADLEARLLAAQQRELERYQPRLNQLAPEHLKILARLLANGEISAT